MKKNKKIICSILVIIGILLICGSLFLFLKNGDNGNKTEKIVSLKDDYYASVNNQNKNYVFEEAQGKIFQNLVELIQEIELMDEDFTNDNYSIFMELFEEFDERDNLGLSNLKAYLDEIDNAKTLDQFSDILVKVDYDLGIKSFINWEVMPDLYDNSKNVIAISPIVIENMDTFLLDEGVIPSGLEFYTNEKYASYKKALENARVRYLTTYGYDDEKAKQVSNDINEFAKRIQSKSLTIDDLTGNYIEYYKNYSLNDLKKIVKNLPIDKLLSKYGISGYNRFALFDEGHIKELDNYYSQEHLPVMKEILKLSILENIASYYTTEDYYKIFVDAYTSITGDGIGNPQMYSNMIGALELIVVKPKLLGSYLNVKYDEKYFTEVEKQEIIELINKMKDHYVEIIKSSDWLGDTTKDEAIKKITNLKVNVGYVQKDDKPSNLKLVRKENGGTLISNYILYKQNEASKVKDTINKKLDMTIDQFKANAYYNPLDNSINFPSGFREIYRNAKDKYEIYAYGGTIVGHEISHAFDNNGSRYDEKGNLKNWWSEEDRALFDSMKKKISDYYSNYEFYGMKVNGELTVGENIADLAGVKSIISIMEQEKATKEDFIKFFETYAKLWNDHLNKAQAEMQMISDTHSPNKVRVNAVLSSMDKFYEVYDIKENDKMFVAPENRVGLW